MNCEGLGLDLGLAPTSPQYVATSDFGIYNSYSNILVTYCSLP